MSMPLAMGVERAALSAAAIIFPALQAAQEQGRGNICGAAFQASASCACSDRLASSDPAQILKQSRATN